MALFKQQKYEKTEMCWSNSVHQSASQQNKVTFRGGTLLQTDCGWGEGKRARREEGQDKVWQVKGKHKQVGFLIGRWLTKAREGKKIGVRQKD